MPLDDHWVYQGRQEHGWFGNGTAPNDDDGDDTPVGSASGLFGPANIGQRVDYAAYSLIGHLPRTAWRHPAAQFNSQSRGKLQTAVAAWYGASGLSRDAFRDRLLGPSTSDAAVDHLRAAARGIVEARDPATLTAAGGDLAAAIRQVGLDRWPRYLGDADRRAVAAVSDGDIPGVVKADLAEDAKRAGIIVLGGLAVPFAMILPRVGRAPDVAPVPAPPNVVLHEAPEGKKESEKKADGEVPPAASEKPNWTPPPDGVVVTDDRRKYILDGDGKGNGGHGPGRDIPGKSEFPSDWSDDRIIEEIKSVANDPASSHEVAENGRVTVTGTRNGIDIFVVIGRDGKTVVTAHPTNTLRNP